MKDFSASYSSSPRDPAPSTHVHLERPINPDYALERSHTMKKTCKLGWKDRQLLARWSNICWEFGKLPTALNCQYIEGGKLEKSAQLWLGIWKAVGESIKRAFGSVRLGPQVWQRSVGSYLIGGSVPGIEASGWIVSDDGSSYPDLSFPPLNRRNTWGWQ